MGYAKRRSSLSSKRKSSTRGRSQSRRGKSLTGYEALVRANRRKPRAERERTSALIVRYWGSVEAYRKATRRQSARARGD
jgi:hypothetical protein